MNYGDETVVIAEIDQSTCGRTYGVNCNAHLSSTGKFKCYNTRGTCQDSASYSSITQTLRFVRKEQSDILKDYAPFIPSLREVRMTPGTLNLGGMSRDQSPLGQRESVTLTFDDHRHSDIFVDKYRTEREGGTAGAKGLVLDGVSAYATSPDSAAADITGDLDFRAHIKPTLWDNGGSQTILAKSNATAAGEAYYFYIIAGGFLRISTSDGANIRTNDSTVAMGDYFADGDEVWVKGTLDINDGAGNRVAKFYYSTDYNPVDESGTWTQLGSTVTTATVVTIQNSAQNLAVGAVSGGGSRLFKGVIYYADVRTPIGGAAPPEVAFDPNYIIAALADGATSFTSGSGEVWTVQSTGRLTSESMFDPYTTGSFWSKWIARNPYYANSNCRVWWGKKGDVLVSFTNFYQSLDGLPAIVYAILLIALQLVFSSAVRGSRYVINTIDGPNEGVVTLTLKDYFSQLEAKKSQAPTANSGYLAANITNVAVAATLAPAGIGNAEYPASGYLCIGDEIVSFTRAADALTIVRGQLGSTAAAHSQEDRVQVALYYNTQPAHLIAQDLLTNYGDGMGGIINTDSWDKSAEALQFNYTGVIHEPTPLSDLIGELAELAGFSLWPNIETGYIELTALRQQHADVTVDDPSWIKDKSLSFKRMVTQRASQVWVYYGRIDPTGDIQDTGNYRSRYLAIDAEAESPEQYGTPAVRKVFSRWIPQFGYNQAQDCGERLLTMFRDPPTVAKYSINVIRKGQLRLAAPYNLRTAETVDATGTPVDTLHVVTSLGGFDDEIAVQSQSVVFQEVPVGATSLTIYLETAANDVNLRQAYNRVFRSLDPAATVTFVVNEGVVLGSSSTATPAVTTGKWPPGVTLNLIVYGRIQGAGGLSGRGGDDVVGSTGEVGGAGGPALKATRALTVTNQGQIYSGGGGGGGGGAATYVDAGGVAEFAGGGAGGGGAGAVVGSGALGGKTSNSSLNLGAIWPGGDGDDGTLDEGGDPGLGSGNIGPWGLSGRGGKGGAPGYAGENGQPAPVAGGGAVGGSAGNYIVGNAFVTWSTLGDVKGGVS